MANVNNGYNSEEEDLDDNDEIDESVSDEIPFLI